MHNCKFTQMWNCGNTSIQLKYNKFLYIEVDGLSPAESKIIIKRLGENYGSRS